MVVQSYSTGVNQGQSRRENKNGITLATMSKLTKKKKHTVYQEKKNTPFIIAGWGFLSEIAKKK